MCGNLRNVNDVFMSFKEPFQEHEIEWRIGRKDKTKTKATVLAYLNARAVADRLDEACGYGNWEVSYQAIDMQPIEETQEKYINGQVIEKEVTKNLKGFLCTIAIKCVDDNNETMEIKRTDGSNCTDFEPFKGGLSGAFKRTASAFGIGRYLYGLSETWVSIDTYGKFTPPKLPMWALPKTSKDDRKEQATPTNHEPTSEQKIVGTTILSNGKYKGKDITELTDIGYLKWLADKGFTDEIKTCAKQRVEELERKEKKVDDDFPF